MRCVVYVASDSVAPVHDATEGPPPILVLANVQFTGGNIIAVRDDVRRSQVLGIKA